MDYAEFELTFLPSVLKMNEVIIVNKNNDEYVFCTYLCDGELHAEGIQPHSYTPKPYPKGGYVIVNDDASVNIFDADGKLLDTYYLVKVARRPLSLKSFKKEREYAEKISKGEY